MFAHTQHGCSEEHWEPLIDHLAHVGERAGGFAAAFGAQGLGQAAGWWHDLGKASQAFQEGVLGADRDEADSDSDIDDGDNASQNREAPARPAEPSTSLPKRRRVDHSTAGARHAVEALGPNLGMLIAYGIAGHHGWLPNHSGDGQTGTLKERLDPNARTIQPLNPPPGITDAVTQKHAVPTTFGRPGSGAQPPTAFQAALLTRMLYSALVDADRLATEHFCNPERSAHRPANPPPAAVLLEQLNHHLQQLIQGRANNPSPVDQHRADVLAACRKQAERPPGIFSLTVPTGGGKTLASMAFALTHADRHQKRRVVYALPYTSIIEQTAETFTKVFGESNILEHHSNLDEEKRDRRSMTAQMAAENFDAPIIVTTNVQLFESLFSAHGSTCRKLHRLARSIIVLDEAQSIPPRLLKPTLAVLDELVRNYGCTVVLCTATQPAITRRDNFPIGLENVTEIVPDPRKLYQAMRRVNVQHVGELDNDALVDRLAEQPQALCIVNTRKHAAALAESLQSHGPVVHLSAAMCPQHRSKLVRKIKQTLGDHQPLRVVSTQVIEAGVDVDFPVVFRAMAGFDSIAQSAGRCNREGKRKQGDVFLFDTDHKPARSLELNVAAAKNLIGDHPDPLDLDAIEAYFRHVYWGESLKGQKKWDTRDVMGCFEAPTVHQFRDADERFRWIDSQTTNIIVPFGERGKQLVDHLLTADQPDWQQLRTAQRYSVSVCNHQLDQLRDNTAVTECFDGRFWVLTNPDAYDHTLGLRFDVDGWDAEQLNI